MMTVKCSCNAAYQVPSEMIGKRVRCRKCSTEFMAVSETRAAVAVDPAITPKPVQVPPPVFKMATKSDAELRKEREDAILAGYVGGQAKDSLEERMAQRHRDSVELNRVPNAITFLFIGVVCFVFAGGSYFVLNRLEDGGLAPVWVWFLVHTGGKWWVPGLLAIAGFWKILVGVGAFARVVDIEEDDQLPSHF